MSLTKDDFGRWAQQYAFEHPFHLTTDSSPLLEERNEDGERNVPTTAWHALRALLRAHQASMFGDCSQRELLDALMDYFDSGCRAWREMTLDELLDEAVSDIAESGIYEEDGEDEPLTVGDVCASVREHFRL